MDYIAREGFRDLADYDYISARVSFRLNLREQFYWSALQAVEKYLKAILLFNEQKVVRLRHSVVAANELILKNTRVPLRLDTPQLRFLNVLEEFGENRYRTSYTQMVGNELPTLDNLVWTIRHYARSFCLEVDGVDKSEWYLQNFPQPNLAEVPTVMQFGDGELEKVLLRDNTDSLRQEFVWCNGYFGEPENAAQTPSIVHTSTHSPLYERDWFKNTMIEYKKTLAEAVREYVKFP